MLKFNKIPKFKPWYTVYLNTSYVKVQCKTYSAIKFVMNNLNTSYVKVQ